MKLEKYPLWLFQQAPQEKINLLVPTGSTFRACNILPDGIYVWYEVTEMEGIALDQKESFTILGTGNKMQVPQNAYFVKLLDWIVETEKGQGVMIYPIYKFK